MVNGAIFAVFGVFAVLAIGISIYKCSRQKKQRAKMEHEYQLLLEDFHQKLAPEVAKRKAEEDDATAGTQIWFSRYAERGRLKHWVLVIGGAKYELRKDRRTGKYIAKKTDWSVEQEKLAIARQDALKKIKVPKVDGYYICLIGWTHLDAAQLNEVFQQVMSQFGTYNLIWNNCQKFLQQFADRIVSRTALDWPWFREHTKTEYQENQTPPLTPDEIIARQQSMMAGQSASQNQVIQNQIMNNINMMNQQLVSQNIAQMGIMNANQQAMMMGNPAMNPAIG